MKKQISFLLILAMMVGLLAGCAGTTVVNNYYYYYYGSEEGEKPTEAPTQKPTEKPEYTGEGALKTGLAMVASAKTTNATADANGAVEYTVDLVAVLVDEEGKIADCVIDSIGATVKFDATGALTSDVTAAILSKNELGDGYNMKLYAGSKYESLGMENTLPTQLPTKEQVEAAQALFA